MFARNADIVNKVLLFLKGTRCTEQDRNPPNQPKSRGSGGGEPNKNLQGLACSEVLWIARFIWGMPWNENQDKETCFDNLWDFYIWPEVLVKQNWELLWGSYFGSYLPGKYLCRKRVWSVLVFFFLFVCFVLFVWGFFGVFFQDLFENIDSINTVFCSVFPSCSPLPRLPQI